MNSRISLHVSPGARRNQITGFADGVWRTKVAAPPIEGKANRELVDFLSEVLAVNKTALAIIRGQGSRHKVVEVSGLSQAEVARRLTAALKV